jgi:SAM-dependent methyltransferase
VLIESCATIRSRFASFVVAGLAVAALVQSLSGQSAPSRKPDVIYVPTPQPVVDAMLDLAQVKRTDVVYDLGSGDGRIVITAAKTFGASGIGIEMDPALVKLATENAAAAGVSDRVRFVTQDLFTANISQATVVTLYLLQSINERLRPKLVRELKPGTRIVSHVFNMGPEWAPERTVTIQRDRIFLWSIPNR